MDANTATHLNIAVRLLLGGAALYVGARWLLPWLLPFLLALAFAAAAERAVGALCARGMRRETAAGLCLLLTLALLAVLLWLLLDRALGELRELLARLPGILDAVLETVDRWKAGLHGLSDRIPPGASAWLAHSGEALRESLERLPASLSTRLLTLLSGAAAGAPGAVLFAVTAIIGAYFTSASYPALLHTLAGLLPERYVARARLLRRELRRTLGRWLRAQLLLLLLTFAALAAAFLLLRVDYALLLALLTALIDALPILGTGTVLLPWALYAYLTGGQARAIGLALTYAAVTVLRSSIQPKLLGDQLGLPPLAALAALYVGWRGWGVWGMLTFPLLAVIGKQVADSGIFRRGNYD
jgi:sporulation integral membrane protein YtvI